MNLRSVRTTSALLCIAVASLFIACAKDDVAPVDVEKQAFEDLRAAIVEAIADPVREAETIRLVGVLEDDLTALRTNIAARKSHVRKLNANYDTSRAEIEAYLAGIEEEVLEHKRRVSETNRALLANVTAEERSAIAKTHTKAMNASINTIQSI
jgi:capsule polysaccharide export protein KpsE/RkpR